MAVVSRAFAVCARCNRETLLWIERDGKRQIPAEDADHTPKPWMRICAWSCTPNGQETVGPAIGNDSKNLTPSDVTICDGCAKGLMQWWTEVETP